MRDPPSRAPARWLVVRYRNAVLLQEHVEPVSPTIKRPRVDALLAAGDLLRVRLRQHPRAFLELLRDGPPRCDPGYPSRTRGSLSPIPEQIPVHVSVTVHCHHLHLGRLSAAQSSLLGLISPPINRHSFGCSPVRERVSQ